MFDPFSLMIGSALLSGASSFLSARSSAASGIRQANAVSKAEGEAVVKERLNTTIRNSYNTALSQTQLALRKQQLAQASADTGAAALGVRGDADAINAASGSIGGSTAAISADIQMKADAAQSRIDAELENAITNYNAELDMMALNTKLSESNVRPIQYTGPSTGEMLGTAAFVAAGSFASNYAMRQMSLGLGAKADTGAPNVPGVGVRFGQGGLGVSPGGYGLRY